MDKRSDERVCLLLDWSDPERPLVSGDEPDAALQLVFLKEEVRRQWKVWAATETRQLTDRASLSVQSPSQFVPTSDASHSDGQRVPLSDCGIIKCQLTAAHHSQGNLLLWKLEHSEEKRKFGKFMRQS